MIITPEGFAVLENDTHLSKWVREQRRLDCDPNIERICCLFQPGQTVVDCGAALGDHTVAYARRVGPHGKVFAIEPNSVQLQCLRHNMKLFPQVSIFGVALGEEEEYAKINYEPNVSASHLTLCSDGEVEMTRLDLILAGTPVHFIKMDIEGYELPALRGARQTIIEHRPKILLEMSIDSRLGICDEEIFDFFRAHNYSYKPFIGNSNDPQYDLLAEPNES